MSFPVFPVTGTGRRPQQSFGAIVRSSLTLGPSTCSPAVPDLFLEGFVRLVTRPPASIATGAHHKYPGPDFHRLDNDTFARRPRSFTALSAHLFKHVKAMLVCTFLLKSHFGNQTSVMFIAKIQIEPCKP